MCAGGGVCMVLSVFVGLRFRHAGEPRSLQPVLTA